MGDNEIKMITNFLLLLEKMSETSMSSSVPETIEAVNLFDFKPPRTPFYN